ncbi:ArsR/SmtB family transcription factor [Natrononativus amylolyticus]|uniref:ArsR/SmtB family transcription factor n=1 Tax=Natrononativus amylolyticus TaxID=2963434 RepID=UPI0020CDF731|nr:helix-turn-helix domain-containing protein [Natrononativus amylolyticus]
MSEPSEEGIPPAEAFSVLGDETRVAIVRALGETPGEALSFSELRERVGARDSGGFNYHLNKLVGSFVRRTDDGYELSYAGVRVVGAILAGEYTRRGSAGTFELESDCTVCETPLSATYEDERVTIRCVACDELRSRFGFPPGGFENRTVDELTDGFDRWLTNVMSLIASGFCFNCAGKTSGRLTGDVEHFGDRPVGVEFICERCGDQATLSVNSYLLLQPAVVAFHYEHGIDVDEAYVWNLEYVLDADVTVLSEEPWRVNSALELEGDRLELVLEEDLSVSIAD